LYLPDVIAHKGTWDKYERFFIGNPFMMLLANAASYKWSCGYLHHIQLTSSCAIARGC